ncbi:5-oxoprolinase subunit PxpA [Deinococcus maricopensis]|uniref:LamB/YcsF family protein n=1 Tax=Deinococcus maricopensis (strain DSM 21211 / LMG 22137 / NRRL B-23946 / LB-34) TaxID=709986 RepID=E8U5L2_DEIML|nr:5-oxoprolinase subunit PxpA [Deinococcus maricopensis]ADV66351.1 LamB/YcsF family protein [Deinococcus maricopensis DSM 21211]
MLSIDLNADLGEGSPHEAGVMPYVTSANIACGGHAGDADTMRRSVRLALQHGVSIGAHPGFPDREGFGRRALHLPPEQVRTFVRAQVEALRAVAVQEGATLTHVKPHGMLYNMAAQDAALATAIAQGAADAGVPLYYGLAGDASVMLGAAHTAGLTPVGEAFADRGYLADGTLVPRGQPGDLLPLDAAITQAVRIATQAQAFTPDGQVVRVPAGTLCLHGDGAEAAPLARALREALAAAGVRVTAPH